VAIVTAEHFDSVYETFQSIRPFRIFTVELNGGRRLEIDHPGALVFRQGVAVFLAPGRVPVFFDHDSVNHVIGSLATTDL
jgi:hypothetical protein